MIIRNPMKKRRTFTVIGANNSGKTVFMTSLLHHLEVNQEKFKLFEFNTVDDLSSFPAERYWRGISELNVWPPKTDKASKTVSTFYQDEKKRKPSTIKRYFRQVVLTLNDVPGERIADTLIFRSSTYEKWVEDLIISLRKRGCADRVDQFIETFDREDATVDAIRISFKKMLAAHVEYGSYAEVSPSSFVLSVEDVKEPQIAPCPTDDPKNKEKWMDYCLHQRFSGLKGMEFYPLPERLLDKDLRKMMRENYKKYRKKVVIPMFNMLLDSHGLVVLVDVLDCLEQGPVYKNAVFSVIEEVVRLAGSDRLWKKLQKTAMKLTHLSSMPVVNRIAYVATKHDLILLAQRENMVELLKTEMRRLDRLNGDVDHSKSFSCAAIQAAQKTKDNKKIAYIGKADDGAVGLVGYSSINIPIKWPEVSSWKGYAFPIAKPDSKWTDRQDGLEYIFNYMLDRN